MHRKRDKANSISESLSLVVEEPDPAVLTASDEGRGSWGVGEISDCCQVACVQQQYKSSCMVKNCLAHPIPHPWWLSHSSDHANTFSYYSWGLSWSVAAAGRLGEQHCHFKCTLVLFSGKVKGDEEYQMCAWNFAKGTLLILTVTIPT